MHFHTRYNRLFWLPHPENLEETHTIFCESDVEAIPRVSLDLLNANFV